MSSKGYIVGRYYWVPCITLGRGPARSLVVPVFGPVHTDREIIGFPYRHWHADPRFMPDRLVRTYGGGGSALRSPLEAVMTLPLSYNNSLQLPEYGPLHDLPVVRLRKCCREMPDFPASSWRRALTEAYAGSQLDREQPVCPHRGMPLSGL